jgi:hypothetical protein
MTLKLNRPASKEKAAGLDEYSNRTVGKLVQVGENNPPVSGWTTKTQRTLRDFVSLRAFAVKNFCRNAPVV